MLVQPLAPALTMTAPQARPPSSIRSKNAPHSSRSNEPCWQYALTNRVQPFTGNSIFEISFTFVRHLDHSGCKLKRVDVSKPKILFKEHKTTRDKENTHEHEKVERERRNAIGALQKSVPFIYNTAMAALIRAGPFTVTDIDDIMDASPACNVEEILLEHSSDGWPSQSIFASVVEALVAVPSIDELFRRVAQDGVYIPMISCDTMTSHEHPSAAMRANILIMHPSAIQMI